MLYNVVFFNEDLTINEIFELIKSGDSLEGRVSSKYYNYKSSIECQAGDVVMVFSNSRGLKYCLVTGSDSEEVQVGKFNIVGKIVWGTEINEAKKRQRKERLRKYMEQAMADKELMDKFDAFARIDSEFASMLKQYKES